ncbi:helix-turn-helix domain-containing protein [Flavobacterium aquiphilum]|uniref:helix-turn-helix domain-containing protein n=1 Tax=Flavobacterium aquiphilum TaxID=3003261 RepID=UPI0032C4B089
MEKDTNPVSVLARTQLHCEKDLSINSIAELSGFPDIANFNRKFKELKGISPSQHRSQF